MTTEYEKLVEDVAGVFSRVEDYRVEARAILALIHDRLQTVTDEMNKAAMSLWLTPGGECTDANLWRAMLAVSPLVKREERGRSEMNIRDQISTYMASHDPPIVGIKEDITRMAETVIAAKDVEITRLRAELELANKRTGGEAMTDNFEKALTARDALVLAIPEVGFGNVKAGVALQNLAKVGWKLIPYHHYPSPGPSGYSPDEFDNQNKRMGISTEQEAKTKVCPLTRSRPVTVEPDGTANPFSGESDCLGSRCMAWKWAQQSMTVNPFTNELTWTNGDEGYCGMAHKAEKEQKE